MKAIDLGQPINLNIQNKTKLQPKEGKLFDSGHIAEGLVMTTLNLCGPATASQKLAEVANPPSGSSGATWSPVLWTL